MTLFISTIVSALFVYAALQVMYAYRKHQMLKKEEKLYESGDGPFGSALCHGMVLNTKKNGVEADSKKSSAWYSRLV
ncbi:MAG: hypothetical protein QM484_13315 [Woeseiaceae bacterium]